MPSSSLLLGVGAVLSTLTSTALAAAKYQVKDSYSGKNWLDAFEFKTVDYNNGFVDYVDETTARKMGLYKVDGDEVVFGVDTSEHLDSADGKDKGRKSVKFEGKTEYNQGLFIIDVKSMPSACGLWPSFWSLGREPWPVKGEIDIIEGVNQNTVNKVVLHTDTNCKVDGTGQTGTAVSKDCALDTAGTAGCDVNDVRSTSFGAGFNSNGGGIYAMEWDNDAIKTWFFPRGTTVPASIGKGEPDTSEFGTPAANFKGSCNIQERFKDQRFIFTNNFCGDWAGNVYSQSSCPQYKDASGQALSSMASCKKYVAEHPEAIKNASWRISSFKTFQKKSVSSSSSSMRTSTRSSTRVSTSTARSSTTPVRTSSVRTSSTVRSSSTPVRSSSTLRSSTRASSTPAHSSSVRASSTPARISSSTRISSSAARSSTPAPSSTPTKKLIVNEDGVVSSSIASSSIDDSVDAEPTPSAGTEPTPSVDAEPTPSVHASSTDGSVSAEVTPTADSSSSDVAAATSDSSSTDSAAATYSASVDAAAQSSVSASVYPTASGYDGSAVYPSASAYDGVGYPTDQHSKAYNGKEPYPTHSHGGHYGDGYDSDSYPTYSAPKSTPCTTSTAQHGYQTPAYPQYPYPKSSVPVYGDYSADKSSAPAYPYHNDAKSSAPVYGDYDSYPTKPVKDDYSNLPSFTPVYPVYPDVTSKPSYDDSYDYNQEGSKTTITTTYTTTYVDVCETGYTTITTTHAVTYCPTPTPAVPTPGSDYPVYPPPGFEITTKVCNKGCGEGPKTVTVTVPCNKCGGYPTVETGKLTSPPAVPTKPSYDNDDKVYTTKVQSKIYQTKVITLSKIAIPESIYFAQQSSAMYNNDKPSDPTYGGDKPSKPTYGGDKPATPTYGSDKPNKPVETPGKPANPSYTGYPVSNGTVSYGTGYAKPSATKTGYGSPQFTGAASSFKAGGLIVVVGAAMALVL